MEWVNDSTYVCDQCDITFKVYVKDDESREIEGVED